MKVKIKTIGEDYTLVDLTEGKEYQLYIKNECINCVQDDSGHILSILLIGCGHLGGGSWEIVE